MHCLGCGVGLSKAEDRRSLTGPDSEGVATIWRLFVSTVDNLREDVNIDAILSGEDSRRPAKMCRRCFTAYQTCYKYHLNIRTNLKAASEPLDLLLTDRDGIQQDLTEHRGSSTVEPASKRSRLTITSQSKLGASASSTNAQSPDVAVHIGYSKPKTFYLTPQRKHIGKAIARKSHKTIAKEALRSEKTKKYIVKALGKELAAEIKEMASEKANSVLQSQEASHLKTFKWDTLFNEISDHTPQLKSLLLAATKTKLLQSNGEDGPHPSRSNVQAVIGMCVAMLLKHRNPNMNLVQKIISLILYAGHSSKEVYQRLGKVNITVSYSSVIRLLDLVGNDFDKQVKKWKNDLLPMLNSSHLIQSQTAPWVDNGRDEDIYGPHLSDDELSDTDSDVSWLSISPITSDEDDASMSPGNEKDSDSSECSDDDDNHDPVIHCPMTISSEETLQSSSLHPTAAHGECTQEATGCNPPTYYHICGDNLDKGIKPRYMRADVTKPDSLHYFHSYAVADRVDFSMLSEQVVLTRQRDKKQIALSLLPTPEDDHALRDNIVILISRILTESLDFFRLSFDNVVEWHIRHQFYKEMSAESVVIPLGIQLRDENQTSQMVDILTDSHKYVPMTEITKTVHVSSIDVSVEVITAIGLPILFAGDQKTAARARGAQKAKINSVSPSRRLLGFVPVVADWHTKVKLLEVIWKCFYSLKSAGDYGTLYQLRNKLNRSNVVKKPKKEVNACEDFIVIVTSGLIVAAALATFQLTSTTGHPTDQLVPGANEIWTLPDVERQQILKDLCGRVYDQFIDFKFSSQNKTQVGNDHIFSYSVQLLRLGCFYLEFQDAIKEGDGARVLRCWKYMIPMFSASGNTNYASEAVNMILQHTYTLSPRLSAQLLWSRFINTHGQPGKNIPVDLHMEHLNKVAKNAIHFLGSNRSEKAITRAGRAIGTLAPLLDNFDENNHVSKSGRAQKKPKALKDIEIVTNELIKAECFVQHSKPRKHSKFPNPKNVLEAKDRQELMDWLIGKLPKSI